MKRILFIDRDGTIIMEPKDNFQVDSFEKLSFLPNAISALKRIITETNYRLVMVTNQDGLGTKAFPEKKFHGPHQLMLTVLENEGIHFDEICIDKTFAKDNAPTRKPNTGMLTHYLDGTFDLSNSYVIGDRLTDIQLAKNLGTKGILIGRSADKTDDNKLNTKILQQAIALKTNNWNAIADFLCSSPPRVAQIQRNTNETKISVTLNLDGKGQFSIKTGLGFFDHMLEQLAKHSGVDLQLKVKGDLHIDEHHTIEDTAIALGEAFYQALGNKRGIQRYGFLLPMDDVLAQVAIDFSGRPWLVWKVNFKREQIGDMPTEMFYHFWKSFSDAAKCNLNIKADGDNEHHKIEAIFKAVAKAIKQAIKVDGNDLPSTKGTL